MGRSYRHPRCAIASPLKPPRYSSPTVREYPADRFWNPCTLRVNIPHYRLGKISFRWCPRSCAKSAKKQIRQIRQSINQSINQSTNQSINQSINHSINHSLNQSINGLNDCPISISSHWQNIPKLRWPLDHRAPWDAQKWSYDAQWCIIVPWIPLCREISAMSHCQRRGTLSGQKIPSWCKTRMKLYSFPDTRIE